jgi:hypothetical protein
LALAVAGRRQGATGGTNSAAHQSTSARAAARQGTYPRPRSSTEQSTRYRPPAWTLTAGRQSKDHYDDQNSTHGGCLQRLLGRKRKPASSVAEALKNLLLPASGTPLTRFAVMAPNVHLHVWLMVVLLPGCQALDEMTYWDQFFDPPRVTTRLDHTVRPTLVSPPQTPLKPVWEVSTRPVPEPPSARPQRALHPAVRPEPTDQTMWVRDIVRAHYWLTQHWSQLTLAQRNQVERQLRNRPQTGDMTAEPAAVWDTMGLADRARLTFPSSAREYPAPLDTRDTLARSGRSSTQGDLDAWQ